MILIPTRGSKSSTGLDLYSSIDVNIEVGSINYMIYIIILFLINSIMVINKKRLSLLLIHIRSWVIRF